MLTLKSIFNIYNNNLKNINSMRKLYLSILAMMAVVMTAHAWSYDMKEEHPILQGSEYNMRLFKSIDYVNCTVNGVSYSDGADFTYGEATKDISINVYNPVPVLNEGLEFMWVQITGTKGVYERSGYGLWNGGSGDRWFAYSGMKAGQIIAIQWGLADASREGNTIVPNVVKNNNNTGWADELIDPLQVEDITAEIHAIQDAEDADGDGEPDGTHDNILYWRVINDGWVYFKMQRSTCVQGVQIWMGNDAAEAVSNPSMSLTAVEYSYRKIKVKPGESTFGNEVETYYTFDGTDPIYLRETEEVLRVDTIWSIDEETGEDVYTLETVYRQEPYQIDGAWGDWIYDTSTGEEAEISISDAEDEDGDGYVTVKVASITADGVMSEIVSMSFSVGEVTLNAPTLTLVGMDDIYRTYQIGWTNNTLCGEEFVVTCETGEGDMAELNVGDLISSAQSITVTVSAEGYSNGVYTLEDLEQEGLSYYRKNEEAASLGTHDWEFQNLPEDIVAKLRGEVTDYYYVVDETTGDTTYYDGPKVESGEIDCPTDATPHFKYWGWNTGDVGKNRVTIDVIVDTIKTEDTTYVEVYYAEEQIGIFEGLVIDCPPNAKNASCIFMYVTPDLGAYFMARPTITIPTVAYGEYVVIGQGKGGSNYVNNTWTSCQMNTNVEGGYTVTLDNGGIHVFYIDVYTTETLPDVIEKVEGPSVNFADIYSLDGRLVRSKANINNAFNGLQKGIYIMNGKKYLVK